MTFKIATWNVNSLRVRLSQVLEWLTAKEPDVLVLQETKLPNEDFPREAFLQRGYQIVYSGQKTYNGVAIISKQLIHDTVTDFPSQHDMQRRILCATIQNIRIINLYVPNGESVTSDKYRYKLAWLNHLNTYITEQLKKFQHLIILGDFNIAPEEEDVHDPALWHGHVLFSEPERGAFQSLLALGLKDCFRLYPQPEKSFSWWDYRMNSFKRKRGLRIDHILATNLLAQNCLQCQIDTNPRTSERPSDHAPVWATFQLKSK